MNPKAQHVGAVEKCNWLSPGKSANRTSPVPGLHISGNGVNQALETALAGRDLLIYASWRMNAVSKRVLQSRWKQRTALRFS